MMLTRKGGGGRVHAKVEIRSKCMNVESQITAITNRHIARLLSRLDEARVPFICLEAVKREFWFMADDIKQVISENKEVEDDRGNRA